MFGPTGAFYYWSATTFATNPNFAWYVGFASGDVFNTGKDVHFDVRAVRAGL